MILRVVRSLLSASTGAPRDSKATQRRDSHHRGGKSSFKADCILSCLSSTGPHPPYARGATTAVLDGASATTSGTSLPVDGHPGRGSGIACIPYLTLANHARGGRTAAHLGDHPFAESCLISGTRRESTTGRGDPLSQRRQCIVNRWPGCREPGVI